MSNVKTVLLNAFAGLRTMFATDDSELLPHIVSEISMSTQVTDRRRLLKIKLKSLAAEAAIIRNEELKAKFSKRPEVQQIREEMHEHRVKDLREESRATLLAYSYIRGKKYRDIEGRSDWNADTAEIAPDWKLRMDKIHSMVTKYGGGKNGSIKVWLSAEPNRPNPPRKPKVPYTGPKGPVAATVEKQ